MSLLVAALAYAPRSPVRWIRWTGWVLLLAILFAPAGFILSILIYLIIMGFN